MDSFGMVFFFFTENAPERKDRTGIIQSKGRRQLQNRVYRAFGKYKYLYIMIPIIKTLGQGCISPFCTLASRMTLIFLPRSTTESKEKVPIHYTSTYAIPEDSP